MNTLTIPNVRQLEQVAALSIAVISEDTKQQAQQYLLQISQSERQLEKDVKALKQPFKDEIAKIDAAAKPWLTTLATRSQSLTAAILAYNTKLRNQVAAANVKIVQRYEDKVAKVEAKAVALDVPTPIVLPPKLQTEPPKTAKLDDGTITTVKVTKWRLKADYGVGNYPDLDKVTADQAADLGIPLCHFLLDTVGIGKIIKAGGTIAGIEKYVEETLSVRSR